MGTVIAIVLCLLVIRVIYKRRTARMPTDTEVNDLQNRLNLLALKRGNK